MMKAYGLNVNLFFKADEKIMHAFRKVPAVAALKDRKGRLLQFWKRLSNWLIRWKLQGKICDGVQPVWIKSCRDREQVRSKIFYFF